MVGVQTFRNLIIAATFLASTAIFLGVSMLGVLVTANERPEP